MKKIRVASVAEIPPGSRRIIESGKMKIGVFNIGGEFHALPNICVHQWGPICEGELTGTMEARADTGWQPQWEREGEILTCPWHSADFDVKTGECLSIPGKKLRKYKVMVENDDVYVQA